MVVKQRHSITAQQTHGALGGSATRGNDVLLAWGTQPSAKLLWVLWDSLSNPPVTIWFLGMWHFSRHADCSNTTPLTVGLGAGRGQRVMLLKLLGYWHLLRRLALIGPSFLGGRWC